MQFFPYSVRILSIFASVRATVFVFVENEIFAPPVTSFQTITLLFVHDISLYQYPVLNIHQEVAGASPLCRKYLFDFFLQKQKRIGRIPFCRLPDDYSNNPPNLVAKKLFAKVMKFVRPRLLGEYRVQDISYLVFSWNNDSKYRSVVYH